MSSLPPHPGITARPRAHVRSVPELCDREVDANRWVLSIAVMNLSEENKLAPARGLRILPPSVLAALESFSQASWLRRIRVFGQTTRPTRDERRQSPGAFAD